MIKAYYNENRREISSVQARLNKIQEWRVFNLFLIAYAFFFL